MVLCLISNKDLNIAFAATTNGTDIVFLTLSRNSPDAQRSMKSPFTAKRSSVLPLGKASSDPEAAPIGLSWLMTILQSESRLLDIRRISFDLSPDLTGQWENGTWVEDNPLGEGGFANVKCLESNGQMYAVKFVRDKNDIDQLANERSVLEKFTEMGHAHVIKLVDVMYAEDHTISLQAIVLQPVGKPLPYLDAKDVNFDQFNGIKDALQYVHGEHDIVHCDVRPSNMIVSEGRFILIDWGMAVSTRTQRSGINGVPGFVHDEILLNKVKCVKYAASTIHDWAGLVYTILAMRFGVSGDAPWRTAYGEPLQAKANRDAWLLNLTEDESYAPIRDIADSVSSSEFNLSSFFGLLEACLPVLGGAFTGGTFSVSLGDSVANAMSSLTIEGETDDAASISERL
jgi:hypothetical protein